MMNNGVYQCSTVYDAKFFIALPSYLQGARGFSITSIVLGSIGLICGIVGMEVCTWNWYFSMLNNYYSVLV